MCIRDSNETYYDTIEMTPYQAQWGTKPKRVWESYVDHELMKEEMKNRHNELYQKMKRKGEQRAQKKNEESNKLKFKVGDLILVKTNPISDAVHKVTVKFCELYQGPYKVTSIKGGATYEVSEINKPETVWGIFNVRQLKQYHHGSRGEWEMGICKSNM